MRTLIVLYLVLLFPNRISAQSEDMGTFRSVERKGRHIVRVVVETDTFVKSKHKITYAKEDYIKRNQIKPDGGAGYILMIDGREPLGANGNTPTAEIRAVKISFDGKSVAVPASLFADCYNPKMNKDSFATKISENGRSLLMFMAGGSGKRGYKMIWVFKKDGRHTRFFSRCTDCDPKKVLEFFESQ